MSWHEYFEWAKLDVAINLIYAGAILAGYGIFLFARRLYKFLKRS